MPDFEYGAIDRILDVAARLSSSLKCDLHRLWETAARMGSFSLFFRRYQKWSSDPRGSFFDPRGSSSEPAMPHLEFSGGVDSSLLRFSPEVPGDGCPDVPLWYLTSDPLNIPGRRYSGLLRSVFSPFHLDFDLVLRFCWWFQGAEIERSDWSVVPSFASLENSDWFVVQTYATLFQIFRWLKGSTPAMCERLTTVAFAGS